MGKDPAFLWYDGDAARDVSHMNRLERGAYFDLVQAQRKFHGITTEQARKILGKDFDAVWPAIEIILEKEENDLFFIPWVRESLKKREIHAENQRKRIQDYWDKKKGLDIPRNNHGNTNVYTGGYTKTIPLENENEYKDLFLRFSKAYPPNGSAIGINVERSFCRLIAGGNDPELIISRAAQYAQYWKDELGDKYPNGKHVAMADNWLDRNQHMIDWSKRERTVKEAKEKVSKGFTLPANFNTVNQSAN